VKYLSLVAAFAVVACASVASASVQFELTTTLAGQSTPTLPSPWGKIRIYDSTDSDPGLAMYGLTANDALIVIDAATLDPSLNIALIGLNFNPGKAIGPAGLNIAWVGSIGVTPTNAFFDATNAFSVDGSLGYDISLEFQGAQRLEGGDVVVLKATYASGILATDFKFGNDILDGTVTDPNDPYYAAARIDIAGGGTSGYVGATSWAAATGSIPQVPEPASLAIWGLGSLFGAVAVYRRKRLAA
jgi:hypothetical protein